MKAERLDYIHIYVKDLEKAKDTFFRLLRTIFSPNYESGRYTNKISYFPLGSGAD